MVMSMTLSMATPVEIRFQIQSINIALLVEAHWKCPIQIWQLCHNGLTKCKISYFVGLNEWEISVYFGPLFVLFKTLFGALTNSALHCLKSESEMKSERQYYQALFFKSEREMKSEKQYHRALFFKSESEIKTWRRKNTYLVEAVTSGCPICRWRFLPWASRVTRRSFHHT